MFAIQISLNSVAQLSQIVFGLSNFALPQKILS